MLIVAGYVVCGVLAYGLMLGSLSREFKWERNTFPSVLVGLAGPLGLFGVIVGLAVVTPKPTWPYILKFKPYTSDERLAFFLQEYPNSDVKLRTERFNRLYR